MPHFFQTNIIQWMILILLFYVVLHITGVLKALKILVIRDRHKDIQTLNYETKIHLVNNALNPMIAIDLEDNIIAWNKKAEDVFGWEEKEVLHKKLVDFIIKGTDREWYQTELSNYKNSWATGMIGNREGVEIEAKKKKGYLCIRMYMFGFQNSIGFTDVGVVVIDLTKEKAKEKEVKDYLALLEKGIEVSCVGSWRWDLLSKDVKVCKNFRRIFDLTETDVVTSTMLMEMVYFEDQEKVEKVLDEALINKKNYSVEYRKMKDNGKLILILCKGALEYNENHEVTVINGSIQIIKEK